MVKVALPAGKWGYKIQEISPRIDQDLLGYDAVYFVILL
jgi:hypothetical protein